MGGYKRLEGSDVSETWIIPTKKKNFNFFIPDISNKDFTKKNGSTTSDKSDNAKEKEVIQIQEDEVTELVNEYRSDRTKI